MYEDFEKKELRYNVSERAVVSVSSTSSLGWKPIRQRGAPRTHAPNFFKSPKAWFRHELWSWRFYVWMYGMGALIVALANLFTLIAISSQHPFDSNGRSTLFEGSCSQVQKSSRYAHWFFSVFGTGYLSASAYVIVSLLKIRHCPALTIAVLHMWAYQRRGRQSTCTEEVARYWRAKHEEHIRHLKEAANLHCAARSQLAFHPILVRLYH